MMTDTTPIGEINLHGLGFIIVPLQGNQRLHVWHPALPRRKCFEHSQIHDHRFEFISRVLVGTQVNRVFHTRLATERNATHASYLHEGERTKFGNRPWILDEYLHVEESYVDRIEAGNDYRMPAYLYHSTPSNGIVVTVMKKTAEFKRHGAHSLCEKGVEPDVDFDRKQWPQERLAAIAIEALSAK